MNQQYIYPLTTRDEQRQRDDLVDRQLLRNIAQDRDTAAMETLYNRYQTRLIPFLQRLTQNEPLLQETYNDVMLKVWRKAHQYKGQSMVSSWVFSIGYRTCLRALKKARRHAPEPLHVPLTNQNDVWGEPGTFASREPVDAEPGAATDTEAQHQAVDNRRMLHSAMQKLSASHRMVIELSYFAGLSTEEISRVVSRPKNTVKTRLHHARNHLRQLLGDRHEFL